MTVTAEAPLDRLLNMQEVGDMLGCRMDSVKKLIYSGEISSVILGARMRRVPLSAVQAYIRHLQEEQS